MTLRKVKVDWCPSCAVAGAKMNHQNASHQMFAYIFTRVVKEIKSLEFINLPVGQTDFSYVVYHQIFEDYFKDLPIAQLWYKKSYWKFMQHLLCESISLYNFKLKVSINKEKDIVLMFKKV